MHDRRGNGATGSEKQVGLFQAWVTLQRLQGVQQGARRLLASTTCTKREKASHRERKPVTHTANHAQRKTITEEDNHGSSQSHTEEEEEEVLKCTREVVELSTSMSSASATDFRTLVPG